MPVSIRWPVSATVVREAVVTAHYGICRPPPDTAVTCRPLRRGAHPSSLRGALRAPLATTPLPTPRARAHRTASGVGWAEPLSDHRAVVAVVVGAVPHARHEHRDPAGDRGD